MENEVEVEVYRYGKPMKKEMRRITAVYVDSGLFEVEHSEHEHLEYTIGARVPWVIQRVW